MMVWEPNSELFELPDKRCSDWLVEITWHLGSQSQHHFPSGSAWHLGIDAKVKYMYWDLLILNESYHTLL